MRNAIPRPPHGVPPTAGRGANPEKDSLRSAPTHRKRPHLLSLRSGGGGRSAPPERTEAPKRRRSRRWARTCECDRGAERPPRAPRSGMRFCLRRGTDAEETVRQVSPRSGSRVRMSFRSGTNERGCLKSSDSLHFFGFGKNPLRSKCRESRNAAYRPALRHPRDRPFSCPAALWRSGCRSPACPRGDWLRARRRWYRPSVCYCCG